MARTIEISGVADILEVTEEIQKHLRNGKIPSVTISVPREQKTARQRGYFYGGIIAGALQSEELKHVSKDDLEDALLEIAATERIQIGNVVDIPRRKRVSAMDTEEMSHLIDMALHWLSKEFGIYIDTPEEYFAKLWRNQNV